MKEEPRMIDLATTAVALLVAYLKDAGTEAAKTLGKDSASAGVKLLGWLREKLTGRARETLTHLEEKPESQLNQDAMRGEIAKLLEKEPNLASGLQKIVVSESAMTQIVGPNAKAGQINNGNQNTITIN
jgi:hypothetical protein